MSRKKYIMSLSENLNKFCDVVDQSVLVYEMGLKNYLHHDMPAFSGNLQTIVKLESDSSIYRHEIEKILYNRTPSVSQFGDIIRLYDLLWLIVEEIYSNLFRLDVQLPKIPSELNTEMLKLADLATSAVTSVIPACKMYLANPDNIPDKIRRVYFYQKETERQVIQINRKIFHEIDSLKQSEKLHLRYLVSHIYDISLSAMKVSDQLSVMNLRNRSRRGMLIESKTLPLVVSICAMVISLLCAYSVLPGSGHKSTHGIVILVAYCAVVLALVVFLMIMIVRARRSKITADNRMVEQEDELVTNNRRISEMEAQIMKMENDHLQNLLELKRKETTGVVEKISEQKDFIDNIYDIVQKAEKADSDESRDALLHEAKAQLSLRRNLTGNQDDFYAQVEQLHKDFSVRLASKFPNLSAQERKLATLLRLEFSTKYIASVLNISPKSVEVERHRLRTKMGLNRGENLTEFIKSI